MSDYFDSLGGIVTVLEASYPKYKKLKLICAYKLGPVYHCETEHENLWVELYLGKILLDKAETPYEIGDNAEVVAKYHGDKPSFLEVAKHFSWDIDENNIWDD